MFPVSGAAQFIASGPSGLRPSDLGQRRVVDVATGPSVHSVLWGRKRFQRPAPLRLVLEVLDHRRVVVRVAGLGHLVAVHRLGRVDAPRP